VVIASAEQTPGPGDKRKAREPSALELLDLQLAAKRTPSANLKPPMLTVDVSAVDTEVRFVLVTLPLPSLFAY